MDKKLDYTWTVLRVKDFIFDNSTRRLILWRSPNGSNYLKCYYDKKSPITSYIMEKILMLEKGDTVYCSHDELDDTETMSRARFNFNERS